MSKVPLTRMTDMGRYATSVWNVHQFCSHFPALLSSQVLGLLSYTDYVVDFLGTFHFMFSSLFCFFFPVKCCSPCFGPCLSAISEFIFWLSKKCWSVLKIICCGRDKDDDEDKDKDEKDVEEGKEKEKSKGKKSKGYGGTDAESAPITD